MTADIAPERWFQIRVLTNSLHCWTRPISNRFSEARERNTDTLELVQLELSESSLAKGASPNYFFHYNVIVTFRGEGVEHVTFWFGTIGLGMSLGLFGLENEARVR